MSVIDTLDTLIQEYTTNAIELRHHIHQHPELRYEEVKTAALVEEQLKRYGYTQIKTGIGGTGVTALLDSGKPGPVVALRADMDALPMQEKTGLSYASKQDGKMHACGHDGHTATLLLVARTLINAPHLLTKGAIKFIFQPAEEGGAGAKAMIDDGALLNPQVDAIFGYHNYPCLPVGHVAVRSGCFMAGSCNFAITIKGTGTHAANPETGVDPIVTLGALIQALQTIVSRNLSPLEQGVVSITQVNAGTAHNIIPDHANLSGTLRATSIEAMQSLQARTAAIAEHICSTFGAQASVKFAEKFYPPTINTPKEAQLIHNTACSFLDNKQVTLLDNVIDMGAEDFSFFLQKVPGCYFGVGNGRPEHEVHSEGYDFNDRILPIAAKLLLLAALNFLAGNYS